jgi:hypothetical protein
VILLIDKHAFHLRGSGLVKKHLRLFLLPTGGKKAFFSKVGLNVMLGQEAAVFIASGLPRLE